MGIKSEVKSIQKGLSSVAKNTDVELGGFGLAAEVVGTTFGTTLRMKEGESFGSAIGKEAVENMKYAVAPYLIPMDISKPFIEMYPDVNKAAEQQYAFNKNYDFLGGGYVDTQQNYVNRARGMQQIKRNRVSIAQDLGNEAKRFHR